MARSVADATRLLEIIAGYDPNDEVTRHSAGTIPASYTQYLDGHKGDNSQVIAPHTGQPAFTVPMGFTTGNLPAGLQFLGRMFDEKTLIKYTYAYEQATHHRKPPEEFHRAASASAAN